MASTRLDFHELLGSVGKGRHYDALLPQSGEMQVGNLVFRVLKLAALIEVKEEVGQPKDRAVLATLRATLEESGE